MIKYICHNCQDLECETSVCPVCGNRTEILESAVFYCPHCEAPSYDSICSVCGSECDSIGTDLRPVFPQERLLLEILLGEPFKYANSSVWNVGSNRYVIDGVKKNISYKELREKNNPINVIEELKKHEYNNIQYIDGFHNSKTIVNFIKINKAHLNVITHEAIEYIREISDGKTEAEMFVSFSGGKDSTVTSDLVLNALGKNIIHIYGDTTLEYPTSEIYVRRFRKTHPLIPLLTAKNKDQDFNNLCEVIGPPSRVMRWCCTVFKTGAITKKIDSTFKDVKQLLTFQGIRRNESLSRSKYDRDSNESKIKKQISANPIIDWLDFDVWLYLISNNVDFNDAYKQGFSRVGCWCCPNNSAWSEFLSSIYMNEEYTKFRNILYTFAEKIGKPDWKVYIDDGEWPHPGQAVMKTLTDITSYTEYVKELSQLFQEEDDVVIDEPVKVNVKDYSKEKFLSEVYISEKEYTNICNLLKLKKNIILQGAPGVGKTYTAKRLAYSLLEKVDTERVQMVQFHQSYSYEDFIEGYRPTEGSFKLSKGIFYNFCKKAAEDDKENKYYFIIDEINRGNLSKIFGELFMLIESDKRNQELPLLYSGDKFKVPSNVYIIGLMNTADRSLAMLDYALRRRFAFYTMNPGFDTEGFISYKNSLNNEKFNKLIYTIEQLNKEIANDESLGEGFEIGHSYFCNYKEMTDDILYNIIEYELIPLLKEYWFDEPSKVRDWSNKLRGNL